MKPSPLIFQRGRLLRIGVLTLLFAGFLAYLFGVMPAHLRPEFSIAMPLYVGLGAVAGVAYFYTLRRPPRYFWMATAGFALALIGAGIALHQYQSHQAQSRLTCPVCGYKTLALAGDSCAVCQVRVSDAAARAQGLDDADALLRAEQIAWFAPAGPADPIHWDAPAPGAAAFEKDTAWRPRVSEAEIRQALQLADSLQDR
jgi:hypothetical protein